MKTYSGNCHCGNVSFSFDHDEAITSGVRCNCSICVRIGAIMSDFLIAPEKLTINLKEKDTLGLYEFDNKVAHHYFCNICGIYPFNQTFRAPDQYRVNLGCIDELDHENLEVGTIDGKSL